MYHSKFTHSKFRAKTSRSLTFNDLQNCFYNSTMLDNNVLEVDVSLAKNEKNLKEEIQKSICALLNCNGGNLVLTASNDTDLANAVKNIRPCEQQFSKVIGIHGVHKYLEI